MRLIFINHHPRIIINDFHSHIQLLFRNFYIYSFFSFDKVVYMHRKQRKPLVYTSTRGFHSNIIGKDIYDYLFINK